MILPKIHFVDNIPEHYIISMIVEGNIHGNNCLKGLFDKGTFDIYILKGIGQTGTLFHELGHWFINIFVKKQKYHNWFDKHFSPPVKKITPNMLEQVNFARKILKLFPMKIDGSIEIP